MRRAAVVGIAALAIGVAAAVAALVATSQPTGAGDVPETPTVYDRAATVTVREASSGPLADLPTGWSSFTAHELDGRSWLVVTSPEGGVAMVPQLDSDGTQHVVPQS